MYSAETDSAYIGDSGIPDAYACAAVDEQPSGLLAIGVNPGCRTPGSYPNRELAFARPEDGSLGIPLGLVPQCPAGSGLEQEYTYTRIIPATPAPQCPVPGYRRTKSKWTPKSPTNPCGPSADHYQETGLTFDENELGLTDVVTYDPTLDETKQPVSFAILVRNGCPDGGFSMRRLSLAGFKKLVLSLLPNTDPSDPGSVIPDQYFVFQNTGNFEDFTGALQVLTIPANGTRMDAWLWGAGGRGDGSNNYPFDPQARGGIGGYTYFTDMVVAGGQQYAIMVGGTLRDNVLQTAIFGFGGKNSPDGHSSNGGGLSGIFTSADAVAVTDDARAIAIAGGGGGGGATGDTTGRVKGGNGNAPSSGGMSNFQGDNGTNGINTGDGGGGGGYRGGSGNNLWGNGGSGYLKAGLTGQIQFADVNDTVPPGTTIARYTDSAGQPDSKGLVIVRIRFTA